MIELKRSAQICLCSLAIPALAQSQVDTNNLVLNYTADRDVQQDTLWTEEVFGSNNFDFAAVPTRDTIADANFDAITRGYDESATGLNQYFESGWPNRSRSNATFELWIEVETLTGGTDQVIFEAGGSGRGISFVLSDSTLSFNVDGDQATDFTVSQSIATGVHHIVGVIECQNDNNANDSIELFLDGVSVGKLDSINIDDWSGGNLSGIGDAASSATGVVSAQPFSGKVATLRYYHDRAFTASEVDLAAKHYRYQTRTNYTGIGFEKNVDLSSDNPGAGGGFTPQKSKLVNGTYWGLHFEVSDGTDGLAVNQFKQMDVYTSTDGVSWTFVKTATERTDHPILEEIRFESIKWEKTTNDKWAVYAKRVRHGPGNLNDYVRELVCLHAQIIDGDYDFKFSEEPYGFSSGDLGIIKSGGRLYVLSTAATENQFNILRTNLEGDDLDQLTAELIWYEADGVTRQKREAPSYFWRNGKHYIVTSGKTGWRPNQQKIAYADSLAGPYSDLIDLGDPTGFHSQIFWTPKISGTLESNYLFNGTRNAQQWGGEGGSRPVRAPIYFNTDTDISSNYYDILVENYTTGQVEGFQLDHGRELAISSVSTSTHTGDSGNLVDGEIIDGDETTAWNVNHNPSLSGTRQITWDLGSPQLVKALKLMPHDPYRRSYKVDVFVGDGTTWTQVYPTADSSPVIPMMTWLAPLDVDDATGRYVRMDLVEAMQDGNVRNYWGLYEAEIWGETSSAGFEFEEIFDGQTDGANPTGWTFLENDPGASATIASVPSSSDKSVQIQDTATNGRIQIAKTLTRQKGSLVVLEADFRMNAVGSGEYIRVLDGGVIAFDIVNSSTTGGLSETDNSWNHKRIADPPSGSWQRLRVEINTDLDTYDLYIDGDLAWGGGKLRNQVSGLDKVIIGTSNQATGVNAYFDNVTVDGPMP